MRRRTLTAFASYSVAAAGLGGLLVAGTTQAAEPYPNRPIKLILPFASGGQSDVVARLVATRMATGLGQPMVVENLAGAGGMIAFAAARRAAPDGYTLFFPSASTLTIAPHLQKGDMRAADFVPVSTAGQFPLVLVVNAASPFMSLGDIVKAAKANPDKLTFASPGYGTTPHLIGETFRQEAGISLTHVPYKGGGPALNDLLAGQVNLYFEAPATLAAHIKAGKLRALAVTSKARMPTLPKVPTVSEVGLTKLTLESWSALVAPQGTPADIVARLKTELDKALKDPTVVQQLQDRGYEVATTTSEQLAHMIDEESRNWAQLIKARKITIE